MNISELKNILENKYLDHTFTVIEQSTPDEDFNTQIKVLIDSIDYNIIFSFNKNMIEELEKSNIKIANGAKELVYENLYKSIEKYI